MSDEVELSDETGEEYEVVPMGPIRRLEKRIEELETSESLSKGETLIRDVVDIMKSNQQMVNNMVDSTNNLKVSVEELMHKMDDVVTDVDRFLDLLEEASKTSLEEDMSHGLGDDIAQEIGRSVSEPLTNKMEELNKTNKEMLEGLSKVGEGIEKLDQRMKRVYASQKGEMFRKHERGERQEGRRMGRRSQERGREERGEGKRAPKPAQRD